MQWVQSLKEGDLIDCIKIESQSKKACWSRAKIGFVLENHYRIAFLNDRESSNRYVEKNNQAHEIAALGTKTKDYEWRMNLKAGDFIDACDPSNVWTPSIIVDQRQLNFDDKFILNEILVGMALYYDSIAIIYLNQSIFT